MGPDLLCFLEDKETKEPILLEVQCKVAKKLDHKTWLSALQSIDLKNRYTVLVLNEHPVVDCNLSFPATS